MNILSIDTATEVCSVAMLTSDGDCEEIFEQDAPQASRVVLDMLQRLFTNTDCGWQDIDLLAFGHGPGSFTGVRVATGLVQGLALGRGLPVMGVSTLAAIAQAALDKEQLDLPVLAALDARMDEIYWGAYRRKGQGLQCLAADRVGSRSDLVLPEKGAWLAAGNAEAAHAEALAALLAEHDLRWVADIVPRASVIARLAAERVAAGEQGVSAEAVRPVYLRQKVTQ